MRRHMVSGALLGLAAVPSCRSDRSTPADNPTALPKPNLVTFTATDFTFNGPPQISAGQTLLQLKNEGREPHHLVVIRAEQGRNYDSVVAALRKPAPPPAWAKVLGGPIAGAPGSEATTEHNLTPGHYAIVCFIPSVDGKPHFAKGMIGPLEVTPGSGAPAAESMTDISLKLTDYDFDLAPALTSGSHVIRVENAASQMHEVVIAKLKPGKSAQDMAAWEVGGRKGEPPGTFLSGMAAIQKGETGIFDITLDPGDYALICFIPDAKDGKPHFIHGMLKQITVG